MSIFETFFKKLFGKRSDFEPPNEGFEGHRQYGDRFRNPIWQTDDEDDDETGADFRRPRSGIHFSIFTDPFEMTRYFESQMDGMLSDFFQGFGSGFGSGFGTIQPFDDNSSFPALPPPEPSQESLRNNFLKPGYEYPSDNESINQKLDTDLDGQKMILPTMPRQDFAYSAVGKSMSTQIIRRSDGTMEQKQTVTDSEGNMETTITRQIGDKTHTIKTIKDKNGVETKVEDLINIDQNELMDFEKKWQKIDEPKVELGTLNPFPWHKYFSFDPKL